MPKIKWYKCDFCGESIDTGFNLIKSIHFNIYRGVIKKREKHMICNKCQLALRDLIRERRTHEDIKTNKGN